jgi:hypothetical protein
MRGVLHPTCPDNSGTRIPRFPWHQSLLYLCLLDTVEASFYCPEISRRPDHQVRAGGRFCKSQRRRQNDRQITATVLFSY